MKWFVIIVVENNIKVIVILWLIRDFLVVNFFILCGDIVQNLGFGDVFCGKGLKVCYWNVQYLINSKFEEIRVLLISLINKEEKLDILILIEMFCLVKVFDLFYFILGY